MQNNMTTTELKTGAIDLSYIRLVSGGDEVFEAEMLLSLRLEIDQKMEALRHDLDGGRREGVRLCAHSLKNLFGMLGSSPLRETFVLMETESMTVNHDRLSRHFAGCQQGWLAMQQEIAGLLAAYQNKASFR